MADSDKPHLWEKKVSIVYADCRIFKVLKTRFRHPVRKSEGDFFVIDASSWITVVAVTKRQELVTVRQFRFGIEDLSLEVPAGVMESDEDPLESGIRELREETGFVGEGAELLGWIYPNPAIQNNRCHVVGIHNVKQVTKTHWDEHEEIETRLVPLGQVADLLAGGEFRHALSLCALQFYFLKYPL
ncbi:MAG: NUDIX hydrolase [Verrucomicrobia bacterium]|nr:NUDIX hydrolase [Verrucomicrobiota bacterium]